MYEEILFELANSFDLFFTKNPRERFKQVTCKFNPDKYRESFEHDDNIQPVENGKNILLTDKSKAYSTRKEYYLYSAHRADMDPR